jgi:ubiquinone/menaquinone biosynthesis C-methylase UbiE
MSTLYKAPTGNKRHNAQVEAAAIPPGFHIATLAPKVKPLWPEAVPGYLEENYWWAYLHPRGVKFFDREWMVNLILFGNMAKLRDAALDEFGRKLEGRTLQVACVYGDFSPKLAECIAPGGTLDIVDVAPIQLANTRRKLADKAPVTLHQRNSNNLAFDSGTFDQVIVFFLMHEQPDGPRDRTLAEAVRVLKPGGKLVLVDYHRPHRWNPMRYFFRPILDFLEPFAVALWDRELASWLPAGARVKRASKSTFFGGLYQKVALTFEPR